MISRVKIEGYKSLSNVEVNLKPLAVLFGPNAAGKSNFLDALQLLSRIATSRTLKEAFEPPYRGKPLESFWLGKGGIEGLLKRESASFSIEVDVKLSPSVKNSVNRQIQEMKRGDISSENNPPSQKSYVHHERLRYRIEVEIIPRSGILTVADEYLAAIDRKGKPIKRPRAFLEKAEQRLRLRMEGQGHPTNFERRLDHSILSRPHYPPHYPHLIAMRRELETCQFFYFEPRERMRATTPVKEVRHIGLMGEELAAFLNTLKNLDRPQFEVVAKALHLMIPSISGIQPDVNKMGEVELSLLEDGKLIPARIVSEGTLRVLGLLALGGVKESPALVGFEEPENGVHPRRIRDIAELLKNYSSSGDTQLVVTTHSPILLDQIPKESLFVCHKEKGDTSINPFSSWGPLGYRPDLLEALDEKRSPLPVSQRILRGDFDA